MLFGFSLYFEIYFWIEFEKHKPLHLEKNPSKSMRPTAMITISKYYTEP